MSATEEAVKPNKYNSLTCSKAVMMDDLILY